MMRGRWSKWLSGVGGVVLIGGLVLANYGGGVMPAEAHNGYQNPFKLSEPVQANLEQAQQILEKLNAGGGGTGGRHRRRGGESIATVGYPQSVSVALYRLTDFSGAV